jgi:hypothetical protein
MGRAAVARLIFRSPALSPSGAQAAVPGDPQRQRPLSPTGRMDASARQLAILFGDPFEPSTR